MLLSHALLMTVYAFLVSLFFCLLWRRNRKARIRLFLQLFLGMMLGGIAIAWIMYWLPTGPPAPFPAG